MIAELIEEKVNEILLKRDQIMALYLNPVLH
jgi:hypothetical protein